MILQMIYIFLLQKSLLGIKYNNTSNIKNHSASE